MQVAFSVVLDREWAGWFGMFWIWKDFMQENFGLILRSLKKLQPGGLFGVLVQNFAPNLALNFPEVFEDFSCSVSRKWTPLKIHQ